ncbi:unnamed protein product [Trichogramma brassicae]|uniref:Uncharacterized protein n=1 Tax=Trichogramma brassicae TaxID=86971 RepID=A0A6H5IK13_9HYME|nr:unnamed protein product [Trichogramma brassicae]
MNPPAEINFFVLAAETKKAKPLLFAVNAFRKSTANTKNTPANQLKPSNIVLYTIQNMFLEPDGSGVLILIMAIKSQKKSDRHFGPAILKLFADELEAVFLFDIALKIAVRDWRLMCVSLSIGMEPAYNFQMEPRIRDVD